MLESFYEYIVKDLLIDYFYTYKIEEGSRFFLIIENNDYRKALLNTLEKYSRKEKFTNIYRGYNSSVIEDSYETLVIDFEDKPSLILAFDTDADGNKRATEDYLTTLRNSIGVNSYYKNYCILFILSDSGLSSLITSSKDLQSEGAPFNTSYIIKNIMNQAEKIFSGPNDSIRLSYFKKHLDYISNNIIDGVCDIFDFKQALKVLREKNISRHYNELGFFEDEDFCNSIFNQDNDLEQIAERINENYKIYEKISNILDNDEFVDDSDNKNLIKKEKLQKLLDEKLAKKIIESNLDWQKIPYKTIEDSRLRKLKTENLALKPLDLPSNLVCNQYGNIEKKSVSHIIVCDKNSDKYKIIARFNKNIKDYLDENNKSDNKIGTNGTNLYIEDKDEILGLRVGINDNYHEFNVKRLACNPSFFKKVVNAFTIKATEIQFSLSEELDSLTLGEGTNCIEVKNKDVIDWSEDKSLIFNLDNADNKTKIIFWVKFNNQKQKFSIKIDGSKIPDIGPESYPLQKIYYGVGRDNIFDKISDGCSEHKTKTYWRKFLDWEKLFVEKSCCLLCCKSNSHCVDCKLREYSNSDCDSHSICINFRTLPETVSKSFVALCDYYRKNNTIPSLCPVDSELEILLRDYCASVKKVIDSIPIDSKQARELTDEEYNISRLGVVEQGDKIYFSPFHPMIAAFTLEYAKRLKGNHNSKQRVAQKLISPFYLLPYIYYTDDSNPERVLRPYSDYQLANFKNWLCFEENTIKPQERMNNITSTVVSARIEEFIKNFDYLFQDFDCPIKITCIGIIQDSYVIKGIIEYIEKFWDKGIQKIELHEYVIDIMEETFFERLNRLNDNESILRELKDKEIVIKDNDKYDYVDMVKMLFRRVVFYKHSLSDCNNEIVYSHIAFYQMEPKANFVRRSILKNDSELSLGGLISVPSTECENNAYYMGFGARDLNHDFSEIYPLAIALNSLYANGVLEGNNTYQHNMALYKMYKFESGSNLLQNIYKNANWVTFINPEVDIDFFYKQRDLCIIHYTDQYTINAKYDSVTVTRKLALYKNMLQKNYSLSYNIPEDDIKTFNLKMISYFNCLNGSWLLEIVNKSKFQIREKMSLVSTTRLILQLLNKNYNAIWVPISLDEILRVSGSIGLPREFIFSQQSLDLKGNMSDDLLFIGLDLSNISNLKLYLYPVEVKVSESKAIASTNKMSEKGLRQVRQTYLELRNNLYNETDDEDTFIKDIYRTFFATQYLTNAEKLHANNLLSDETYLLINQHKFDLLNLNYQICDLPNSKFGNAGLVTYYVKDFPHIRVNNADNVEVYEYHLRADDSFKFVIETDDNILSYIEKQEITEESINQYNNALEDEKRIDNLNLVVNLENKQLYSKTTEYEKNRKTDNSLLESKRNIEEIPYLDDIRKLMSDFSQACGLRGITVEGLDATNAVVGPSVIRFRFKLKNGQSIDNLTSRLKDIAREMKKSDTGLLVQNIKNSDELFLDVPRFNREEVLYKDVSDLIPISKHIEEMWAPIGKTPEGEDIIKNVAEIPHLLIGGSTGSGKTILLFTILASILKQHKGENDIKLVLSSAGIEDFVHFEGLPQLINGKVLTSAEETVKVIMEVVDSEFEKRARILSEARVSNIIEYNRKFVNNQLPPILVVIDEFADISDQLKKQEKEQFFTVVRRIVQIGRKRGIHLILCTQRPSANLVPTDIKAQLNGRIALCVNDLTSSRMILDEPGAELLQKHGDMYIRYNNEKIRAQGYYISLNELDSVIEEIKNYNKR